MYQNRVLNRIGVYTFLFIATTTNCIRSIFFVRTAREEISSSKRAQKIERKRLNSFTIATS